MERYEYMPLPIKIIPQETIDQYQLQDLVHNWHVHNKIQKGMYGLPHADKLANQKLTLHLAKSGYISIKHTPGLLRHLKKSITFSLVVDDLA